MSDEWKEEWMDLMPPPTIGGVFRLTMSADQPNANGRVYPRHVLEEAIRKAQAKPGTLLVHNTDGDTQPRSLDTVIGVVNDLYLDEHDAICAKVRFADNRAGLCAKTAHQAGAKISMSSCCEGKIKDGVVTEMEFETLRAIIGWSARPCDAFVQKG